jgi:phosphoribosylamine--glycine ligase
MRVLVIGQGGREHAIARALLLSPSVTEVHALPGHDGLRKQCVCHSVSWRDFEAVITLCLRTEIDLVIIGPEEPLSLGLADALRERGILTVGPSQAGAQLEASKVFAKKFMNSAGIPTARFSEVDSMNSLLEAATEFKPPYVLKADGLAAGKGVFIAESLAELKKAGEEIFVLNKLGPAGAKALLEDFTLGQEISYIVLTNGKDFSALPMAQDHKRLLNHGKGPNTGGMGTVAPISLSNEWVERINETVVKPTLKELERRGILYRGFIFFGLMMNPSGPSLLEFNCRLGDPETQVILPLLDCDFGVLMRNLGQGTIEKLVFKNLAAACIVMTTKGYPDQPSAAVHIDGDVFFETPNSYFIHAGTRLEISSGKWHTQGGRVLGAVGLGQTKSEAVKAAYAQSEKVVWEGLHKRTDIGAEDFQISTKPSGI